MRASADNLQVAASASSLSKNLPAFALELNGRVGKLYTHLLDEPAA